ncbi:hypothetical protein Tco_0537033 [Tanacetum coccineum]
MGGSSSQPHTKEPNSFQETAHEESLVEVAAPPPKSKLKPTRGRQKMMIQNEDAPRQITWTNEEEIALCIGWVYYMDSKTKQYGRQTNDVENGAEDEDYFNMTLLGYEADTGVQFKLRHYWEVLKGSLKWMQNKVPNFLAKSGEGSVTPSNLCMQRNVEYPKALHYWVNSTRSENDF